MDIRAKRSGVFMGSMVDAGEEVQNLTLVPQILSYNICVLSASSYPESKRYVKINFSIHCAFNLDCFHTLWSQPIPFLFIIYDNCHCTFLHSTISTIALLSVP